jgi:hypothetical protein
MVVVMKQERKKKKYCNSRFHVLCKCFVIKLPFFLIR